MQTLVDSHCHLDLLSLNDFDGKLSNILKHAHQCGVTHFLCAAVSLQKHDVLMNFANTYKEVSISVGCHPNNSIEEKVSIEILQRLANHSKVVAIGETGLDYYRSQGKTGWQKTCFITHIEAAKLCNKPIIIHSRSAKQDTMSLLKEHHEDKLQGVFHCFSEDWEMAKFGLDLGFYISFSGVVTFKNAYTVQEIVKKIPLDRLLIESDSPYLTPVPHRGSSNVPGYVKYTAQCIAQLRKTTFEEIAYQTTKNYHALFELVASNEKEY